MPVNVTCKWIDVPGWTEAPGYGLPDDVDVWHIPISSQIQHLDTYRSLLSPDEQQRADRYHHQNDRERFTVSRGALRILLSRYLDLSTTAIEFGIGPNKKPFINQNLNLHYNTAHSGDHILIAVANTPVGVDIEQMLLDFPYTDLLEHSFSTHEIACIKNAERPLDTFYAFWTRKEALLKATAKGIDDDMPQIPCTDGDHTITEELIGPVQNWVINTFNYTENCVCSVAAESQAISFRKFTFSQ